MKSKFFRLLTLFSVLTIFVSTVSAQPSARTTTGNPESTAFPAPKPQNLTAEPFTNVTVRNADSVVLGETKGATEPATYIVMLAGAPVATYAGDLEGFPATSPLQTGATQVEVEAAAVIAYQNYLKARQDSFRQTVEDRLGRSIEVKFQYRMAFNGLAMVLTPSEAAAIARVPGVVQVQKDFVRYPTTDAGPQWIGANSIWDGTATGAPSQGEGVIVGVIDTGLNMDSPSFAGVGQDGYVHINPFGAGNYVGLCDSNPGSWVCNDKLLGYWIYTGENHEDQDGHGSHTASSSAGNVVYSTTAVLNAATFVYSATISGVAPHANVIMYDACEDGGGCPGSALVAAIDQTITDTVDVINYSIGGGSSDPWTDANSLAFLNVMAANIVPVTSAGNSGPGAATVGSPAEAPWVITVGASTHNRHFGNDLINMFGGTSPPADMNGKSITAGYGPAPIVYAGDFGDALCLSTFPGGTFSGEIVVCDRGQIARVDKGANVLAGGAGGMVLANLDEDGNSISADPHFLPAVHLGDRDGDILKTWLASGTGHTATIEGTIVDLSSSNGDIMAGFSSRGPNLSVGDIIKPDVTAPGVDIFAAYRDGEEFWVISGTSMSSPHTAGAAALLKALHPTWSPMEIKSALMSTGTTSHYKEDGITLADPFDLGGGRIQVAMAAKAGLILDETEANFMAADPNANGQPKDLNLPSLGEDECLEICTWSRVFTSAIGDPMTWTISSTGPMTITTDVISFTLPAGGTIPISITADVSSLSPGDWYFGEVVLTPNTTAVPTAHLPLAVIPTSGVLPGRVDIHTRRAAGSTTLEDIESKEITALSTNLYGLTKATMVQESLLIDLTNGDPYDNLNDGTTFFITTTVPAGTIRLVAETTYSTADDIDLYVGSGPTPTQATELCIGGTINIVEYCELTNPDPGEYWILVQNWDDSGSPPDRVTLHYGTVPDSGAGNMTVTGPTAVGGGVPYDLLVAYDLPDAMPGDRYYGAFDLGSSGASPGDIGTIPVNLVRYEDDVTKTVNDPTPEVGDILTYTLSILPNVTGVDQTYSITDTIPLSLSYVLGSATASEGTVAVSGNLLTYTGVAQASQYAIAPSSSPFGYVSLAGLAISPLPCSTACDDEIATIPSGLDFYYLGHHYDSVDIGTNGFIVPGSGASGNILFNQDLPDPTNPNNVIAPFWTDIDLDGGDGVGGGTWYAADVTNGFSTWHVFEWENAEQWFDPASVYTFQIWIEKGTDNIWFVYDNLTGNIAFATVGFENDDGLVGESYYYDGVGTPPAPGVDLAVGPVLGQPIIIDYNVIANDPGVFTNTAIHTVDNPSSETASTTETIFVGGTYLTIIKK